MHKKASIDILVVLLFFSACSIKVGIKVPEKKFIKPIPVSDNPYIQMVRALDSFQLDANILLNAGLFTIPELPVVGNVNLEVPENLNIHVFLNIKVEKTYSEDDAGVRHLTALIPSIELASISPNIPIPVRATGIGFDFKGLSYEKETLTTELTLKLNLISFFISPAVGIPVDQVNQDVMIGMINAIHINSLKGNFTPRETLSLKEISLVLREGSSVELKNTVYTDEEHVSGIISLNLDLKNFIWISGDNKLRGDDTSSLKLEDINFTYQEGSCRIEGKKDPFILSFAGSFFSKVAGFQIAPSSELVFKSFNVQYKKDSGPIASASMRTKWSVIDGFIDLPETKLILENSVLEISETIFKRNQEGSLLTVKDMNMDVRVSFEPKNPDELLRMINEGVQDSVKPPITSFHVTNIYLPGQNYRIEGLSLELENWKKINRVEARFLLKLEAGPLLDFEVGFNLSVDTVLSATLMVDDLMVPLSFEYDGKQSQFSGESGFEAGATLKTNKPALIYRDTLGHHISKIPKQLSDIRKTPFSIFLLPSTLSLKAEPRLVVKEERYYLEISQLAFSGNMNTKFDAGKVALINLEIPFGSDAVYKIAASKKLPMGKSIKLKDSVKINGDILTAPFLSMETISVPLGKRPPPKEVASFWR